MSVIRTMEDEKKERSERLTRVKKAVEEVIEANDPEHTIEFVLILVGTSPSDSTEPGEVETRESGLHNREYDLMLGVHCDKCAFDHIDYALHMFVEDVVREGGEGGAPVGYDTKIPD